jgi:hypothetical protein
MGWTNPLTATYLGYLTEGVWNTHVRDNLLALRNDMPYCIAYASTAVSLTPDTWTTIALNNEADNGGMHDNSTNNSRITFVEQGTYLIHAQVAAASIPSGAAIGVRIRLNGSDVWGTVYTAAIGVDGNGISTTTIMTRAASDYIEMQVLQNDASSRNTVEWDTFMFARRIAS